MSVQLVSITFAAVLGRGVLVCQPLDDVAQSPQAKGHNNLTLATLQCPTTHKALISQCLRTKHPLGAPWIADVTSKIPL